METRVRNYKCKKEICKGNWYTNHKSRKKAESTEYDVESAIWTSKET